ncbi:MAG: hypothetical protein HWD61_02190 [Parachlamydiaceae bacterium]|nr:MAG: hypothetical protein HWD61_02190 [Parachlamydiaceae bacterium]
MSFPEPSSFEEFEEREFLFEDSETGAFSLGVFFLHFEHHLLRRKVFALDLMTSQECFCEDSSA